MGPKPASTSRIAPITTKVTPKLRKQLEQDAKRQNMPLSALVAQILQDHTVSEVSRPKA